MDLLRIKGSAADPGTCAFVNCPAACRISEFCLLPGSHDSLVAHMVRNLPAAKEIQVWFLDWEDPLKKEMATGSSILAWRISWTEEPGGLQSMRLLRVRHDWATNTFTFLTLLPVQIILILLFHFIHPNPDYLPRLVNIYQILWILSFSQFYPWTGRNWNIHHIKRHTYFWVHLLWSNFSTTVTLTLPDNVLRWNLGTKRGGCSWWFWVFGGGHPIEKPCDQILRQRCYRKFGGRVFLPNLWSGTQTLWTTHIPLPWRIKFTVFLYHFISRNDYRVLINYLLC